MVLDIPDLAHRIGRLHGARAVQLVLVDGMRFDLGLGVQDRLSGLLGRNAALTERLLVWAALPSTTAVQLELLGKGPAGLREPTTSGELEVPVARGRAAVTLRRVRTAGRDLMKLDVVESRLLEPGPALKRRLDDLAEETAEALAGHMLRLPPRTLVMVFGGSPASSWTRRAVGPAPGGEVEPRRKKSWCPPSPGSLAASTEHLLPVPELRLEGGFAARSAAASRSRRS